MMNAIFELANTQPDSIDWANPDHWINERLSGDAQRLARKIWEGSGKALNPRYLYGHHKIISRLKLLELVEGTYVSGERGRQFLAGEKRPCRADGPASVQAPRCSTGRPVRRISGEYFRASCVLFTGISRPPGLVLQRSRRAPLANPRGRRALALPCGKSCESVSSRCSIRLWRSAFADEGRRAITCSCACQEIVK
jgi:hypothetical protein